MATLREIEEHWTLEDVIMANLQITYSIRQREDADERAAAEVEARARSRKGRR